MVETPNERVAAEIAVLRDLRDSMRRHGLDGITIRTAAPLQPIDPIQRIDLEDLDSDEARAAVDAAMADLLALTEDE